MLTAVWFVQETTAREVVMLVLKEFGITDPSRWGGQTGRRLQHTSVICSHCSCSASVPRLETVRLFPVTTRFVRWAWRWRGWSSRSVCLTRWPTCLTGSASTAGTLHSPHTPHKPSFSPHAPQTFIHPTCPTNLHSPHKSHKPSFTPHAPQTFIHPTRPTNLHSPHTPHKPAFTPHVPQTFIHPTRPTNLHSAHTPHKPSFIPHTPQTFIHPTRPTNLHSAHTPHKPSFSPHAPQTFIHPTHPTNVHSPHTPHKPSFASTTCTWRLLSGTVLRLYVASALRYCVEAVRGICSQVLCWGCT